MWQKNYTKWNSSKFILKYILTNYATIIFNWNQKIIYLKINLEKKVFDSKHKNLKINDMRIIVLELVNFKKLWWLSLKKFNTHKKCTTLV